MRHSDNNVNQTDQDNTTHWMVRVADSDLFRKLPAANVRILLEHLEKVTASAGDIIIRQSDPGDYYYVVEKGSCRVSRQDENGADVTLADLSVGEAFGEEEMVAGSGRNASVTMLTDGELLRLDKQHFIDVVRDPLVDKVPHAIAQRMHTEGAMWIDVRPETEFCNGSLDGAINIPLQHLRENARDLLKDQAYVVCGESPGAAAVGTLLLAQRGFDAVCMTEPVSATSVNTTGQETTATDEPAETVVTFPDPREPAAETTPVHNEPANEVSTDEDLDSSEPIPRDLYDDTYVGRSLADLIDQMHTKHEQLLRAENEPAGADSDPVEVIDLDAFESEVEQALPSRPAEAPALSLTGDEPAVSNVAEPAGAPVTEPRPPGDPVSAIMQTLEAELRRQIEAGVEAQRAQVRQAMEARIAEVKQAAVHEVRKQVEAYRKRYRDEHAHKEQQLKAQYDKLMGHAHRISRQKAELQRARRDLQTKLEATARLQSEIDGLRSNLSGRLGSFDDIDDDSSELP